jgi:endoglucanase
MSSRAIATCLVLSALAVMGALILVVGLSPSTGYTRIGEPRGCVSQSSSGVSSERIATLARGFNLTGWLDGDTPRRPDDRVLAALRARGFTHIRLPVKAERLMDAFSSRDEVVRQLAELDAAIDTLTAIGFGVSIDLHPGDRFGRLHKSDPVLGFDLINELWRVLAQRFASRSPERVFFEVLNEPTIPVAVWNEQGPRLAATIRQQAPNHTIVYGPANFQQIAALTELAPLDDPNVVYAVHFYEPMVFTHQGLDWSDDPLRFLRGVPFPTRLADPSIEKQLAELRRGGRDRSADLLTSQLQRPWTEERITAAFAPARAWAERYRRPVIVNEFGVLGWKTAPADRARWIAATRRAAEANCMGWAHWEYADGFGFVRRVGNREIPDEAIIDALLEGEPGAPQRQPSPRSH